jgi:ParB/RepB/Spo0J family partition protein
MAKKNSTPSAASAHTAANDSPEQPAQTTAEMAVLSLSAIVASATNPRTVFNLPRLQELADSIKASGVHQPILVRPLPGSRLQETFADRKRNDPLPTHEIVAGERRYRASKLAGVATIPALIRQLTDDQVLEVQLVENLQRDDLHPMEEAEGYERLCQATGISKEEIAVKVGKSRAYVYARMQLLALSAAARKAFESDEIDSSRALVIARIPDPQLQQKALEEATRKDWAGGLAMNFREFAHWSQQNCMLSLGSAVFKITDESLNPDAGSCTACPKRTGASPDLFADVGASDVCIDPKCFHDKEATHKERTIAAARESGQKVIVGKDARKIWEYEYREPDGYKRLDKPDHRLAGNKTLAKVLGKDAPEPVLLENPHKPGELIEVLPAEKVNDILKAKGLLSTSQLRSSREMTAGEAKQKIVEKYEKAWRKRAITAIYDATGVVDAGSLSERVVKLAALGWISELSQDERTHTAELLGIGKVADREGIVAYIHECNDAQAERVLMLLMMQTDMRHWHTYSEGPTPAKHIEAVAADYAVDIGAIQAEVKEALKEAAKPKPPKEAKAKATPGAKPARKPKASKAEASAAIAKALESAGNANAFEVGQRVRIKTDLRKGHDILHTSHVEAEILRPQGDRAWELQPLGLGFTVCADYTEIEAIEADGGPWTSGEEDPLYADAVAHARNEERVSTASIQRHLRIGYNRAARLVEAMQAEGIAAPMNSSGDEFAEPEDEGAGG